MPGQAPFPADETELLLGYLNQQREGLRNAAFGLTDEQARIAPTVSTLTIGGLVKHVAFTEQHWIDLAAGRERSAEDQRKAYEEGFTFGPDEKLADVVAFLDRVHAETEAAVRSLPLDHPVPVPDQPWMPKDIAAWDLRWVLLHIIEETARHAGHADLVRESIDGATMYALMAGREGWPATDWLTPWTPPA